MIGDFHKLILEVNDDGLFFIVDVPVTRKRGNKKFRFPVSHQAFTDFINIDFRSGERMLLQGSFLALKNKAF
jgi:hypothetical protein